MGPFGAGGREEVGGAGLFHQLTSVHEHDTLGDPLGEAHLVGDDHHGHAVLGERAHDLQDFVPQLGVQCGKVLVDTTSALQLQEASYAAVFYVPRADAKMDRLTKTQHSTHCPFKGDASYFTVKDEPAAEGENAVWTYETPFDEVASIKDGLAFYGNKLTIKATPAS